MKVLHVAVFDGHRLAFRLSTIWLGLGRRRPNARADASSHARDRPRWTGYRCRSCLGRLRGSAGAGGRPRP